MPLPISRPLLTRRRFLQSLGAVTSIAAAGAVYTRFGEPRWLDVSTLRVGSTDGATPPVRIVHLSDFHASAVVPYAFIEDAISVALAQKPDAIALTGDFITNHLPEPERYSKILSRLSALAPTFACLGNHDGGPWTRRAGGLPTIANTRAMLEAAGIVCLHNEAHALSLRGRWFQFIGVGDFWSEMCLPNEAFARVPTRGKAYRVLLNHNPDAKDRMQLHDWDLMLCGHTHGGQLKLPLFGTPFAPVVDKRFVEGLHRWQGRWLYITRGIGNLHGMRFNCRPEVSVLDVA
ncbi:MAG: phosphodiesterase YaeI [Verrucomicrobiota bacterium]